MMRQHRRLPLLALRLVPSTWLYPLPPTTKEMACVPLQQQQQRRHLQVWAAAQCQLVVARRHRLWFLYVLKTATGARFGM